MNISGKSIIRIACSVGSYGAVLANGSEYSGCFNGASKQDTINCHRSKVQLLLQHEPKPDIILFETIPSLLEAEAIVDLCNSSKWGIEVYVSVCSTDGVNVCHGESVESCVRILCLAKCIITIGINCIHPKYASSLIQIIHSIFACLNRLDISISCKPNSGEEWDHVAKKWIVSKVSNLNQWIHMGASKIGGCCRTGPAHVQVIRKVVDSMQQ